MSKIAVVYWSGTGNTEAMAKSVAAGARSAGAEVELLTAAEFGPDKLSAYDAAAFGCPAMGSEQLEEDEFEPDVLGLQAGAEGQKDSSLRLLRLGRRRVDALLGGRRRSPMARTSSVRALSAPTRPTPRLRPPAKPWARPWLERKTK